MGQLAGQINGDDPLDYKTQTALVAELRWSLTAAKTAKDARTLLIRMRERRELLATIAADIDRMLGTSTTILAASRTRWRRTSALLALLLVGGLILTFPIHDFGEYWRRIPPNTS